MRRIGLGLALAGLWAMGGCGGAVPGGSPGAGLAAGPGASSGAVGRACMAAGRQATPDLCSCVQGVANQALTAGDQRRVAGFFADPEEAQAARTSDTSWDEQFWDRYRAFADRAEALCG